MVNCAICLSDAGAAEYHRGCLEGLFGAPRVPALDLDLASLYRLAAQMAGKMSISGVQEKVSLGISADGAAFEVASSGGRYILKPQSFRFAALPENEHVTMRMATVVSIEVPPFGLVRLKDNTLAYVVKRFDRLDDGTKLQVEDFCQLAGKPLRDKYDGSAELCVRIVRKYASEPLIEIRKLYRLLVFAWWTANGDMHLKNFSLLTKPDRMNRLSPAYDLVCTKLALPEDSLAISVGGRDKKLTRRHWLELAAYCGIPERAATRVLTEQVDALGPALEILAHSFLPQQMKEQYEAILRENTSVLARGALGPEEHDA